MSFNFGHLEPQIRRILSAPGTDLTTISAKRVRRQLVEIDPSLSAEFLKEHKDAVDAVIARVFEQVSSDQAGGDEDEYLDEERGHDRHGDDDDEEEENVKPGKPRPHTKTKNRPDSADGMDVDDVGPLPRSTGSKPKKSRKNSQELIDAELARRLSSEINGRSTRTGSKPSKTSKKGSSRAKKSSATVDSDDSDSGSVKRTRKSTPAKGGFGKEFVLSSPLAALLQTDKLSRPQVVKHLWVYIKEHELQNPENKREILCDPNFKAVFGVDKIDMFKMNKVLGQHLHEESDA